MTLTRIRSKWDALAALQLRAELARLETELAEMTARAERAENSRDRWMEIADQRRDEILDLMEQSSQQPGLTRDGRLVAIHTTEKTA